MKELAILSTSAVWSFFLSSLIIFSYRKTAKCEDLKLEHMHVFVHPASTDFQHCSQLCVVGGSWGGGGGGDGESFLPVNEDIWRFSTEQGGLMA